ncbi:ganglioside-induced differentiation-associated protein 1-like [Diadema setosum]|uniref:ganglioside-induced differentiation-associated protein 1-like n=1 Tax=Diadema setosum TaxID=31175 RepID=UPI003B3A72F4
MDSTVPLLYHATISGLCQRVCLSFAEKGIEYRSRLLNIVAGDQYDPHYLRVVNPNGSMPTLEHGGEYIRESSDIIKFIDELPSEKPKLIPDENTELRVRFDRMLELVNSLHVIVPRMLAMTVPHLAQNPVLSEETRLRILEKIGEGRKLRLLRLKDEHPDLAEVAQAFIDRIPPPLPPSKKEAMLLKQLDLWDKGFAEIETVLEEQKKTSGGQEYWLCADHITLPDIHLIVLLHRLVFIGQAERLFLVKRPLLANYYQRFTSRQSFREHCGTVNEAWHSL